MNPPVWKVQYCKDFEELYDKWLLMVEDPNRQTETADIWDQLTAHKTKCTVCVREDH